MSTAESFLQTPSGRSTPERWKEALTRDEIDALLEMSDVRSAFSLVLDWALIAASFALVYAAPNPLTVVVALLVIGGRQLGLAILMHEAAHRSLFRNRRVNDVVGNWLCAYPIWGDIGPYRQYHLQHHAKTGSDADPDLALARPFPITRESFRRKVWRDLSGQTGWKRARATLARDLGKSRGKARRITDAGLASLRGVVLTNVVFFALVSVLGHPALYLLWVTAWLTTYSLVMRIRSIAEHGMIPDRLDPVRNTRTTLASPIERLLLAPNRVNYHLEHHLLMMVPHYNLPRMHVLLRQRGALAPECVTRGYWEVLRLATSRKAPTSPTRTEAAADAELAQRPPF